MGGEGGNANDVVGQGGVSRYARTAVIRSRFVASLPMDSEVLCVIHDEDSQGKLCTS